MLPIMLLSVATPGKSYYPAKAIRATYLELLRHHSELRGLALLGYCLMSNHVHLIAVPRAAEALGELSSMLTDATPRIGTRGILQAGMCGRVAFILVRSMKLICGGRCVMWS
jgi:hypothetical protein